MAANSGIFWIDFVFDECVHLLYVWADMLGITYEEINVWLFVVVGPTALLASVIANVWMWRRLKAAPKPSSGPVAN